MLNRAVPTATPALRNDTVMPRGQAKEGGGRGTSKSQLLFGFVILQQYRHADKKKPRLCFQGSCWVGHFARVPAGIYPIQVAGRFCTALRTLPELPVGTRVSTRSPRVGLVLLSYPVPAGRFSTTVVRGTQTPGNVVLLSVP